MSIKIHMGPVLHKSTGNDLTVQVSGKTVSECLDNLMIKFPETRKWVFDKNGVLMILVVSNGKTIVQRDLDNPVLDGDDIRLVALIGGG